MRHFLSLLITSILWSAQSLAQVTLLPGDFVARGSVSSPNEVDGTLFRIDGVTGNKQPFATIPSFRGGAVAVARSGQVYTGFDNRLVSVSPATGAITTVSEGGLLAGAPALLAIREIEDGSLIVSTGTRVLKINPATGAQQQIYASPTSQTGLVLDLCPAAPGEMYLATDDIFPKPGGNFYFSTRIERLNLSTGQVTPVSSDNMLLISLVTSMTKLSDGSLMLLNLAGQIGQLNRFTRVDPITGEQFAVLDASAAAASTNVVLSRGDQFYTGGAGGLFQFNLDTGLCTLVTPAESIHTIAVVPIPAPAALAFALPLALAASRRRR